MFPCKSFLALVTAAWRIWISSPLSSGREQTFQTASVLCFLRISPVMWPYVEWLKPIEQVWTLTSLTSSLMKFQGHGLWSQAALQVKLKRATDPHFVPQAAINRSYMKTWVTGQNVSELILKSSNLNKAGPVLRLPSFACQARVFFNRMPTS